MSTCVSLIPPLFEESCLEDYLKSGRTVSFTLRPTANELALFATPLDADFRTGQPTSQNYPKEQDVYVTCWDEVPTSERRLFITDTSIIFAAFRALVDHVKTNEPELMRAMEYMTAFRKLAGDYITHIQECWVHASQTISRPQEDTRFTGEHYRSMYTSLSIFQTLYLPEEGIDDVPVGDELLEWLNTHFIEPSTEEGDQLSALEKPWEDETFWQYLIRVTLRGLTKSSIFFLQALSQHPSEHLQMISEKLVSILEKHPRQKNYATEKEFFTASRRWKDRAKALRLELDRVPDDDRQDEFENWWDNISDLLGIIEGRAEVLQRVCVELGGDWKEIICTWGVWIDVGLRRAELPDIAGRVMYDVPSDPSSKEDSLHADLFLGRPLQALSVAHDIDVWLAAHLADIMIPLGLLDSETDDESKLTIRDQYVIAYADYLQSDPGLWRHTVDYLCSCGPVGHQMADEILLRVPLRLEESAGKHDAETSDGDLAEVVKDINNTCFEYQREPVRRMICKVAAQKLVMMKKYGLAISYCLSAEDWPGLGRIVDRVLNEYIAHGPSRFTSLVADIAPSLQELQVEPGPHGVFVQRLKFAVRYAEFHHRSRSGAVDYAALDLISMFEEDLAPKSWWGVLLNDSTPFLQNESTLYFSAADASLLLRRLEEVKIQTDHGYGDDYLGVLARTMNLTGAKEALKRLDVLRICLARYFARCILKGKSRIV
ncbi:hypothetical protein BD410DRAFT_786808 [Rickenella mellea]|uniref:Nuclear pore complex protein Nup85 n=1 Tax=Rickenella mellea TaxID=50990 RepID=A0A4Y7QA56_9AGAM|nr:hypothetical protein BD410DRAFT_786808 [Rickenella mellea]